MNSGEEVKSSSFTRTNFRLNENSPRCCYRRRADEEKSTVHWGQRKLLLSEIQFLTLFWDPRKVPKPSVVYAGAAPGIHIPMLSAMFPDCTFHCYDPAPFKIPPTPKIVLYQQYFTDADAERWSGRNDVLFISDIRAADYKLLEERYGEKEGKRRNEEKIWEDMEAQQVWHLTINPVASLLKFRLPYVLDEFDRQLKKSYLAGHVFFQVWPPQTSTETRLVPIRDSSGLYYDKEWDILTYEEQLFYHNSVEREQKKFLNPLTGLDDNIDGEELTNDYDSTAEAYILREYVIRMNTTVNPDMVVNLSRTITAQLNLHRKSRKTLSGVRQSIIRAPQHTQSKKGRRNYGRRALDPYPVPRKDPQTST